MALNRLGDLPPKGGSHQQSAVSSNLTAVSSDLVLSWLRRTVVGLSVWAILIAKIPVCL